MKITNVSTKTVYLKDLKFTPESQTEGRRGEDRYVDPSSSVYLPDTSEVLRSAHYGDIKKFIDSGILTAHDTLSIDAVGGANDHVVINHGLNYLPAVSIYKQVGNTWVDATGTMDIVHNNTFNSVTITNSTAFALTVLIKIG